MALCGQFSQVHPKKLFWDEEAVVPKPGDRPLFRSALAVVSSTPSAPMSLPLEVLADLQLTVDGEDVSVQADGKRIVINLASLKAGRRLLQSYPLSGGEQDLEPTDRLHDALRIAGLTVEVRLQGKTIARIGKRARPGRLSRLFNLDGVEVRPTPSLRAAAQDRPIVSRLVIGGLVVLVGWLLVRLLRS